VSLQKVTVSYHSVFITVCAKNICLQHERKRGDADATRLHCITSNNCVTQSGPLAGNASFQFVDVRDLSKVLLTKNYGTVGSKAYTLYRSILGLVFSSDWRHCHRWVLP